LDQSSEIEGAHPPQKGRSRRVIRVGDFCMIHKAMDNPPKHILCCGGTVKMATMTNGGRRGIHSMDGVRPHQAGLESKISDAPVPFSQQNSQTCSGSQQYHLDLKITSIIQVEILECIY
jgi:hypothetical protein